MEVKESASGAASLSWQKDYHKLLQPAMLQKRLQTPDEGAQNGTQGNSGNA